MREYNYGALNGMPVFRLDVERKQHIHNPYPHGESYFQATQRVESLLKAISCIMDGKRVVMIWHSATKWALDNLLCGMEPEALMDAPFGWKGGWLYSMPVWLAKQRSR